MVEQKAPDDLRWNDPSTCSMHVHHCQKCQPSPHPFPVCSVFGVAACPEGDVAEGHWQHWKLEPSVPVLLLKHPLGSHILVLFSLRHPSGFVSWQLACVFAYIHTTLHVHACNHCWFYQVMLCSSTTVFVNWLCYVHLPKALSTCRHGKYNTGFNSYCNYCSVCQLITVCICDSIVVLICVIIAIKCFEKCGISMNIDQKTSKFLVSWHPYRLT